jgi:hypothetical protein
MIQGFYYGTQLTDRPATMKLVIELSGFITIPTMHLPPGCTESVVLVVTYLIQMKRIGHRINRDTAFS